LCHQWEQIPKDSKENTNICTLFLAQALLHLFTIFFVDPTVPGKKEKKNASSHRKGEEEAKTTNVNDFSQPRPLCI